MRPNRDDSGAADPDASDAASTTAGPGPEAGAGAGPGSESRAGALEASESGDERGGVGGRDVVVPLRLYKTITVFSTLIAVLFVVLGFVLLDAATQAGGVIRVVVVAVLGVLGAGVTGASLASFFEALSPALAALGLCSVAFGAGVYVLGTRFRARGMGKSQEDSAEDSDDG